MADYTPKHGDPKPNNKRFKKSENAENIKNIENVEEPEVQTKTKKTKLTRKKIIYYIALSASTALLIALIIILCIKYFGGRENFDEFMNSNTSSTSSLPPNPIDFAKLQSEHPEVCAWIRIDGIDEISYPILQSSPEKDDNYYLNRDLEGNTRNTGSIYIQRLNNKDFTDPNTLIYGHDTFNGTLFGQLKKFRDKTFFDEHRTIYIYTPDCILKYEIISAFVYDNRHILNSFNFNIENECQEFFNECINPKSLVKQVVDGATLTTNDKIITLSTCTSNSSERYLVVGKLVGKAETQKIIIPPKK
ncbi:MAG: class B sortase [Clostridia bacterium]|nr:class B sortase [Clostridia bacterium]